MIIFYKQKNNNHTTKLYLDNGSLILKKIK